MLLVLLARVGGLRIRKGFGNFPSERVWGSDIDFVGVVGACLERNIQVFFIREVIRKRYCSYQAYQRLEEIKNESAIQNYYEARI